MKIKEILKKARGLLIRYGWQKYDVGRDGGKMCAMGALNKAEHGYPSYNYDADGGYTTTPAAKAFCKALALPLHRNGSPVTSLVVWNNETCKTRADVLRGFDRAIKATKS